MKMRLPQLVLASSWLLSVALLLISCCAVAQTQGEIISKHTLEQDKQQLAEIESEFQSVKQAFQDFGTRIKNFFSPKSNHPTPRPRDHIPAVVQEADDTSTLEEAVVIMAALSNDDTGEVQDEEEKMNTHKRLWRLISKALH